MLAAAALCLGFITQTMTFSPIGRRSVDLLEYLALAVDRAASVLDLRGLQHCAWHEPAMTTAHSKALRCAMAVIIAALPQCGVPTACAVSPPPIDSSRLPEPARARPTQPTVQREICAVPSMSPDADRANASSQLSGLDLPQVWKLTRGSGQRVAVIDTGVARALATSAHCGRRGLCVYRRRHPRLRRAWNGRGRDHLRRTGSPSCGWFQRGRPGCQFDQHPPVQHQVRRSGGSVQFRLRRCRAPWRKPFERAADLGASVINISSVACIRVGSALDDRALGAALSYAVDVKNVVVVVAAGNTGAGQCPAQSTRSDVGHRDGCGQSGLVRRLRADRRLGERARRTVVVHPGRTLGGRRRPRRGGDIAEFVGQRIDE